MLWLALYLPDLGMALHQRGADPRMPLAIYTRHGARRLIHSTNDSARRTGIHPGMAISAARALSRQCVLRPRDPAAERQALEALAGWAGQFTSTLSIRSNQGLLLEVGASLTLFGGLAKLYEQARRGIAELGYVGQTAVAPTPLAAWVLARHNDTDPVTDPTRLPSRLAPLPLHHLQLSQADLATLGGMGLRSIGQCLILPRSGLGRRLGRDLPDRLARLLGHSPDPLPLYRTPQHFSSRLWLPSEVQDSQALLFAAARLLRELSGFLRGQSGGVERFALDLLHRKQPPTSLELHLLSPSSNADHLLELLRQRLESLPLKHSVEGLRLHVERIRPVRGSHGELFDSVPQQQEQGRELLERLQARLGNEAIYGLAPQADHRPERAWRRQSPGSGMTPLPPPPRQPRPLWLLPRPQALRQRSEVPWLDGPLQLLEGPERIETGWWDGHGTRRDYFIARGPGQERLWVYRELDGERGWYLHGVFD